MSITIYDAIAHLYQIATVDRHTQSTQRLDRLADFCVQELAQRGLMGATKETLIPGIGRPKQWDIAWQHDSKIRLGISLKSILRNLGGAVPNRIDDLMGEVANVQLYSPEIVIGYITVLDRSADHMSTKHGQYWTDVFRSYIDKLSGRQSPGWSPGTVEAYVVAEVDFSESPKLLSPPATFDEFFDHLAETVRERNPGACS